MLITLPQAGFFIKNLFFQKNRHILAEVFTLKFNRLKSKKQ